MVRHPPTCAPSDTDLGQEERRCKQGSGRCNPACCTCLSGRKIPEPGRLERYLPHALQLLNGRQHGNIEDLSELFLRMGVCLRIDGRYREALAWLEKSCQQRVHLSEDDPDRLYSQYNLAVTYTYDR